MKIFFLLIFFINTLIASLVFSQPKINSYLLGTSYYPQWWTENQWDTDFKKMAETGLNTVRMGDLAWSSFEPNEGKYNFEWMDKAIQTASKHGISVILCTPTASIPPWLVQKYPDVLSGNEKGRYDFGTRKGHNTNSENLLNACEKITIEMIKHFGNNKNIIGWQLDNEPGYPFLMYDEISKTAFQQWLKNKYGTLDKLNDAWQGAFWSLMYNDWAQIPLPPLNKADGNVCPGHMLDYRRFFSWSFQKYLIRQQQILKNGIGNRFIFTNWPNTHWSVDLFESAGFLDFCGWDSYMEYAGINDFRGQYEATIHHDLCRTTEANQYFIVSEEAAQANSWAPTKGIRLKLLMDFAHGSGGTLFYEWNSPLGGAEQGFSSILNPDRTTGASYNDLKQACREISELSPYLQNSKIESEIGIVFCYDNEWNQGFWGSNSVRGYDENISLFYKGLKALKQNIDLVSIKSQFSKYKILAIPGLQILSDSLAEKLKNYVANGGILLLDKNCGTKDVFNRLRPLTSPGVFADLAGISIAFLDNKVYGDAKTSIKIDLNSKQFSPYSYIDLIELKTAQNLAVFKGGNLENKPAITVNNYKKGSVVYVGSDSKDVSFYESLALELGTKFNIKPIIEAPIEIEVVKRITSTEDFIFLSNLSNKPQNITLPEKMYEMISKNNLSGEIQIGGLDMLVLKRSLRKSIK